MPILYKTVYVITNTVTGRKYVGSTSRKPKYRFENHLNCLRGNRHSNVELQKDFNKYGEECFEFSILEECTHIGNTNPEYDWIEKLRTFDSQYGYNTTESGVNKIRRKYGLPVPESPLKGRSRKSASARRTVYDNVKQICDELGISVSKLEADIGFERSQVNKWKTSIPMADKIITIATYLGVSTDRLLADVPGWRPKEE